MKLTERAMLVTYSEQRWQARKYDRKVSGEVAQAHHASDSVGRYNKNTLPIDAPTYKAVHQAYNAARTYHYAQTLPWNDDGPRILPATNYLDYTAGMRKHTRTIDLAVAEFVADYPVLVQSARAVLNSLYDPADYPTASELRSKFSHSLRILPLPDAEDFRVSLTDDAVKAIRADIEASVNASVQVGMTDLYKRLLDATAHIATRLKDTDAIFRDSLIVNVRELCEILPRLNLTGDPRLETLRQEVENDLASWEPDDLRSSKPLRAEIARKADAIEAKLRGILGV